MDPDHRGVLSDHFDHGERPNGKYDDPSLIEKTKQGTGLRGIRIWDATDPANIVLLSEFSTDGGDPKRKVQAGSGTHRNYYDGGDYAYLDTAPDDSFSNMESPIRWHGNGIMVVDVSDPANPKQVAMWWVPGSAPAKSRSTGPGANTATRFPSPASTARCTCRGRWRTAASSATAPTAPSAC